MDRFETQALENWPLKPIIWLRFIDDIFMIWPHGNIELDHVIEYLKTIHEKIKFKSEVAPTVLMFWHHSKIDLGNTLHTTLYEKSTDTHLYLH